MQTLSFDFDEFKVLGQTFLRDLVQELESLGVLARKLKADHLCYRVSTMGEYFDLKNRFSQWGRLLTEAPVNGRMISTFHLQKPFRTQDHEVYLIELPSPKAGTSYKSGFEHAEFLIQEDFEVFRNQYPHLQFHEAGRSILNPELCLKLQDKQAKFHHVSLDRVIAIEESNITDIVFDFDGTLIQSREVIYEINRIVFSEVLDREVTLEEAIANFHPEFSKLFEAFAITCSKKREYAVSNWGRVAEGFSYELFEGAKELLVRLKAQGYQLHLWTARDERSSRKILKHHQIEEFFTTLSFADSVNSKPHGKSLKFDWKSKSPNKIIVIGDSPADMQGSKNIGALAAAALWDPYARRSSLVAAGAELYFHNLSEINEWFETSEALP